MIVAFALRDERHNMPGEWVSGHHGGDFNVADTAFFASGEQHLLDTDLALYVAVQQRVNSEGLKEFFAFGEVDVVPRSISEHLGVFGMFFVAGE